MTPPRPLPDARGRALRDLRISVTDRCNFRCGYCMPADVFGDRHRFLPRSEILSFEEIERLVRVFVQLGVAKLRITGGEPLVRAELPSLLARLARIEGIRDIALTTNGSLLASRARDLAGAGLRRITLSLDSLDPDVFAQLSGTASPLDRVLEGLAAAESAGLSPIKINCVVQRGVNEDAIGQLVRRFRGTGHIVRFIEFMDVGNVNGWSLERVVSGREIVERIDAEFPLVPLDANYRGEVAQRYAFRDGAGEIGIIASVTQPFCGGCTRARLSAEGSLVTCLFATNGVDLKTPLRAGASDEELAQRITSVWAVRRDRYSEERHDRGPRTAPRIEMYRIGG
jgi:cyclic pyranopterin phosphate synthase